MKILAAVVLTNHDMYPEVAKLRLLSIAFLCVVLSPVVLSQTKQVFHPKGEVDFGGAEKDRIITHKFLDDGNKLLLIGHKTVRVLDVVSATFEETRPLEIPEFFGEDHERLISPDGLRMLIFGNYNRKDKKNKTKRAPALWDLRTGKQIAVLTKTVRPIRTASWSKNGKTIATSSILDGSVIEISFWDGETGKFKASLPATNVNWWYLTADGARCLYATAPVNKRLFLGKAIAEAGGAIEVWDINRGRVDSTISVINSSSETEVRGISVSPDERLLAFVAQSKSATNKLAMWQIDGTRIERKYELDPSPEIQGYAIQYGVRFSPDSKYFAFAADKRLEIYETDTGEKRFELANFDFIPRYWLNENKILLYDSPDKMEAVEIATGRDLYQQKLVYDAMDPGGMEQITVFDQTQIVPQPQGTMFLTYSNQYVKVFDPQTGVVLQTLLAPQMDYTKKKPKLVARLGVDSADWSKDGRTIYVIGADKTSILLWRTNEK